ncbi:Hypothetical Protein RradSPS_2660 [Rubrobacter radiotolerans]|uniref:Uncharacterized protein n=1 Tax=Rubrobacter radiotolerans TaxID=42256 RepID=A0A023X6G7_RUBRA|nr:hypothetical protein [Rubrobacter radiotolerans]AHY47943.1 Hypothetical Protein RradSPS_2660 [Rubrobacter radiotolerans]MDX5892581.1 hypothetical protein [Rubrobacter radiotolerans]SMC07870.1 hypothetical protein SAMN00767673_2732 [Rubrobacter radiotolerans DSM 5868]
MEGGSEACLEREVEKLREAGLSAEEISTRTGLEVGWIESLLALWEGPAGEGERDG